VLSFGYGGYLLQPNTDELYAFARTYSPGLGRFNEIDPVRSWDPMMAMGSHRYSLAYGNALRYVDPDGRIGIFNDGTWNDRFNPATIADDGITNVARLYDLYDGDRKFYQTGIGTKWYTKHACGFTGCGFNARVNAAYEEISRTYSDSASTKEDLEIDIFGFSRGAAESRALVNMLIDQGVRVDVERQVWAPGGTPVGGRLQTVKSSRYVPAKIRFVGLFDSVSAMGLPTDPRNLSDDYLHTYNQDLDFSKIGTVRHSVAANEGRRAFDLVSIRNCADCPLPKNAREDFFLGAHSDNGGGYGVSEGFGYAAAIPLAYHYLAARNAGVPMNIDSDLIDIARQYDSEMLESVYATIHDSRMLLERLTDRQERTVYYGNWQDEDAAVTHSFEELMRRAYNFAKDASAVMIESKEQPDSEPAKK